MAEPKQSSQRLFQAVQWCKFGVLPQPLHPTLHQQTWSCQKCNWGCGTKVVLPGTVNGVRVIPLRTARIAAQLCQGNLNCRCKPTPACILPCTLRHPVPSILDPGSSLCLPEAPTQSWPGPGLPPACILHAVCGGALMCLGLKQCWCASAPDMHNSTPSVQPQPANCTAPHIMYTDITLHPYAANTAHTASVPACAQMHK